MPRSIDIWAVCLHSPDAALDRCASTLSSDEEARSARFRFDHLQRAFILTRGMLRILLGRYLCIAPAAIHFAYGTKGKPRLTGPSRMHFNSSHSGDMVAFAFALDFEIGIDIEKVRPMPDLTRIAQQFFCAGEMADLVLEAPDSPEERFFRCWTRKEAYIKAVGEGLSMPLSSFAVTLKRADPVEFVHLGGDPEEAKAWMLHDLALAAGYAGALAYRNTARPLRVRRVITATDWRTFLDKESGM